MKAICSLLKCLYCLVLLTAVSDGSAFAQSSTSSVPVVTIVATDPIASGPATPGEFTVLRAGDTNMTLNVYYQIGGMASNGVDYVQISNFILIPAGSVSNSITIAPINNGSLAAIKTVVLHLAPSPLMTPVNFSIGSPDTATVYITPPGVTNLPPVAAIVSPTNNQIFYAPVNMTLLAKASSPNGAVTSVEFFAGTNDLGPGHLIVLDPPVGGGISGPVYWLDWQNVQPNQYSLAAVATDNEGLVTTSSPVNIAVLPGPVPTNLPPVVRITSPPNGSAYRAPINIPLYAYAADPDGSVTTVEFYAGTNSLGFGQPVIAVPPPLPPGQVQPPILLIASNYWELVWMNTPAGNNVVLTAIATGKGGLSSTSNPVSISILPSLPPPTNRPPIVTIVATDPVAIEGTNCWAWPGETNSTPTWAAWPTAVCRWFTNYAPKTAAFTVSRRGETNDDLNVTYDIGGTASNGIDYVALPGTVKIPAGQERAWITIVPIDDGPPDVNKTVILTLTPSTNKPADHVVGIPRRAAVIIIDSNSPRHVNAKLTDNCFHLVSSAPDAAWYSIEWSTDMIIWQPICTNQVINGSIDFVDPDAQVNPSRFYRTVPLTGPPSD